MTIRSFALKVTFLCLLTSSVVAQEKDELLKKVGPTIAGDNPIERFVKECVLITPGKPGFPKTFKIGVTDPAVHEIPARDAEIEHPFRISMYEVTQELYESVAGKNPSRWQGPRNSVENVTYRDMVRFCERLTLKLHERKLIPQNESVRLPTSVEWEYCCRAGTTSRFCFGDDVGADDSTSILDSYAWHTGNAAGNDPAVGVLKANRWGLYDVHGYLWECVADPQANDDPQSSTPKLSLRGGSWRDAHPLLSSSSYLSFSETQSSDAIGFRCVIAEKPPTKNGLKR